MGHSETVFRLCHWEVGRFKRGARYYLYIEDNITQYVVDRILFPHQGLDEILWLVRVTYFPEILATRRDGRVHLPTPEGYPQTLTDAGLEIRNTSKIIRPGDGLVVLGVNQICKGGIYMVDGRPRPMYYTDDPK